MLAIIPSHLGSFNARIQADSAFGDHIFVLSLDDNIDKLLTRINVGKPELCRVWAPSGGDKVT